MDSLKPIKGKRATWEVCTGRLLLRAGTLLFLIGMTCALVAIWTENAKVGDTSGVITITAFAAILSGAVTSDMHDHRSRYSKCNKVTIPLPWREPVRDN